MSARPRAGTQVRRRAREGPGGERLSRPRGPASCVSAPMDARQALGNRLDDAVLFSLGTRRGFTGMTVGRRRFRGAVRYMPVVK